MVFLSSDYSLSGDPNRSRALIARPHFPATNVRNRIAQSFRQKNVIARDELMHGRKSRVFLTLAIKKHPFGAPAIVPVRLEKAARHRKQAWPCAAVRIIRGGGLANHRLLFLGDAALPFSGEYENKRENMSFLPLPEPDPELLARRARIARDLARIAPEAVLIEEEQGRRTYAGDAFSSHQNAPLLVVLPSSTKEIAALLAYCHGENIQVIARGAGTSQCGGATPTEDSIIIGLSRMRRILDIDPENRTARVECGVTPLGLSLALGEHDFFYAPDPSSAAACTIGGNIATNAGGDHGLKYGVTTHHLMGVRMVLMNGDILDLGGEALDCPGYDFPGLITGSEGQLGIVTEAVLRILRKPEMARPMLIGFHNAKDAESCVSAILSSGMIPAALEFMDRRAIHISEAHAKAGYPLDVEALLIVEAEGSENEIGLQFDHVRDLAARFDPKAIRTAQTEEERERIWRGRKAAFGAMGEMSDYLCMDGVIPISRLADVLGWVDHIGRHHDFEVANVFHAGDGTLYSMIHYDANDEDETRRALACGAELARLCVKAGGCLTGEQGIGLEKRDLMHDQFSRLDLVQQTRIKSVFDPGWLLNPAKVFPLDAPGRGGIDADLAEISQPGGESER